MSRASEPANKATAAIEDADVRGLKVENEDLPVWTEAHARQPATEQFLRPAVSTAESEFLLHGPAFARAPQPRPAISDDGDAADRIYTETR